MLLACLLTLPWLTTACALTGLISCVRPRMRRLLSSGGSPRDRSGAELLLVEDGRRPSNLVSGRIGRSVTTIPGIREGRLRGGGTILGNGALTGPGQTAAIRRPRIGARGCRPLGGRPLGPYAAFNAAPSG